MPSRLVAAQAVDPLRAYVRELRKAAGLTQQQVADELGLTRRAYVLWENAKTKDIKLENARALIRLLDGALAHLDVIDDLSVDDARELAREWLKLTADERVASLRTREKYQRVIRLAADDPAALEQIVEQLRNDARADKTLLTLISGFLDGRRSGRSAQE